MLSNQNSYLSTGLLKVLVTPLSDMFLLSLQIPILILILSWSLILSGFSRNVMLSYIQTILFIYLVVAMLLKWIYYFQCYCYIRNTNLGIPKMHIFSYDWVIQSVYVSCLDYKSSCRMERGTLERWFSVLAVWSMSLHQSLIRNVSCESDFPLYLKLLPKQMPFPPSCGKGKNKKDKKLCQVLPGTVNS